MQGGHGNQGTQKTRSVRDPRHRPHGESEPQGPRRTQPDDRRGYPYSRQDRGEIPDGQSCKRFNLSPQVTSSRKKKLKASSVELAFVVMASASTPKRQGPPT